MRGKNPCGCFVRLLFFFSLLLFVSPAWANPITDIHEEELFQEKTIGNLIAAIALESVCVWWLLKRWRSPVFFVAWIIGMHVVTYPLFLTLVWLGIRLPPGMAVSIGEAAIVVIEGSIVFLMCRYAPARAPENPKPSIFRTVFASLIGNACSAAVFPLLMGIYRL